MSYIGNTKIGKMFLGNTEIAKVYLGNDLVFQKGGGTPSPVFYNRLVFDGTAYIDTDLLIPANGTIQGTFSRETLKGFQYLFSAGGLIYAFLNTSTNATNRYCSISYDRTNSIINGTTMSVPWSTTAYQMFLTPLRVSFGSVHTFSKGDTHPTTGLVLGQSSGHTSQAFTGQMGTIKIFGSDAQNITSFSELSNYTPVYTLRPCTYNGEAGFWCVETDTFYGNTAGAGSLSVEN